MARETQMTLLMERLYDIPFTKWIYFLKLRLQTRQWRSSLDLNSYQIFRDVNHKAIGITIKFPFLIKEATFVRRMGSAALDLIAEWWFESPQDDRIECPASVGPPRETYWILIRNANVGLYFDQWVDQVERCFSDNGWQWNINEGHEVIRDADDDPVGIYVTLSYPMSYTRFLDRMDEKMDLFSYVSKTTRDMPQYQLTECYNMGFFNPVDDFY